ncbi:hypothetical protein GOC34_14790 [Sinorhizobium meliloti]|uniref:hypothetical protein n=1 Tax=Rhizobium meliloti TaxID=382 RepID=UPI000FD95396|nr:hypothetical protein [Sinorhizobium meliloti]MDX0325150.1 hypothetical protein [Sinorhizobium meliloti]
MMPVVGYLVIFNSTLAAWLGTTLSKRTIAGVPDFWDRMFDRNLLLLYFGLLIFGLGVALYNAAVPSQVKRFPSVEDYIGAMESIGTRNLAIGSFDHVVAMYFRNLHGEETSPMFSGKNTSFPAHVSSGFHRLVEEMFNAAEIEDWEDSPEEDRLGSRFRSGSGYLMVDEVAEVMYSGRGIDRNFRHSMYGEAVERSKDVYYIEHKALEHSKPLFRFMTFGLYSVGLFLTSFPSLVTSIIILRSW